jgi:hypothetical protein
MSDLISDKSAKAQSDNTVQFTNGLNGFYRTELVIAALIALCIYEKVGIGISIMGGAIIYWLATLNRTLLAQTYHRERGFIMQEEIVERLRILQDQIEKWNQR